jgi:hypothetical protein
MSRTSRVYWTRRRRIRFMSIPRPVFGGAIRGGKPRVAIPMGFGRRRIETRAMRRITSRRGSRRRRPGPRAEAVIFPSGISVEAFAPGGAYVDMPAHRMAQRIQTLLFERPVLKPTTYRRSVESESQRYARFLREARAEVEQIAPN